MARFSVGRDDDDGEGPSNRRPKKLRPTDTSTAHTNSNSTPTTTTTRTPDQHHPPGRSCVVSSHSDDAEEDSVPLGECLREMQAAAAEEEQQEEDDDAHEDEEVESVAASDEEDDEEQEEDNDEDLFPTMDDIDIANPSPITENPPAAAAAPPPPGAAREASNPNRDVGSGDRELGVPGRDDSISVILTDTDVLDCPICLEPLSAPVFQCENGHTACSSCCSKIKNKCPSCSWPIGYNRCRALEKVLEAVKIPCRHMKYGCKDSPSYSQKLDHALACTHAPCSCPLLDCNFIGSSKQLYQHFSSKHSGSTTRFFYGRSLSVSLDMNEKCLFLQEEFEGAIFVLSRAVETLGDVVSVNCIGPSSSRRGFSYEVEAKSGGSSVRLKSVTENIPGWVENRPQKTFLVIPKDFAGASVQQLKLEIRIWSSLGQC